MTKQTTIVVISSLRVKCSGENWSKWLDRISSTFGSRDFGFNALASNSKLCTWHFEKELGLVAPMPL